MEVGVLFIIIAIAVIALVLNAYSDNTSKLIEDNPIDDNYTSGYNKIWLETRKGFSKFEMVGMYYRGLRKSDMGRFEGYAKAEKHNSHDLYAVGIYKKTGRHVGYLPAGNSSIYKFIDSNGGSMIAYGYISCDKYGKDYTGEVAIKTNPALNTDNPFYNQKIVIVGRFDISQKELASTLRNMGAYISDSVYEHTDMILIGENIKNTQLIDKVEYFNSRGCNIISINKEELNKILEAYR